MTGPKIGPSSVGTPITDMTRPRRCGPAVWASTLMPTGMIMPPPKPCRTRKKISDSADHARPHSAEPSAEQRDRDHPHPLGPEALRHPARQRDHDRQREHVARRDPLDGVQRRVELAGERLERDVDDRRVEDRHDHADGDDGGDDPDLAAQRLVGVLRYGRSGANGHGSEYAIVFGAAGGADDALTRVRARTSRGAFRPAPRPMSRPRSRCCPAWRGRAEAVRSAWAARYSSAPMHVGPISPAMERRTFRFSPAPESVPRARETVVELAEPFIELERIPDLRLVISEVITNAVRHGGEGDMLVAVTPKRDYLCVQVTDTGDGFAPRPRAYEPDEDGGFGLLPRRAPHPPVGPHARGQQHARLVRVRLRRPPPGRRVARATPRAP